MTKFRVSVTSDPSIGSGGVDSILTYQSSLEMQGIMRAIPCQLEEIFDQQVATFDTQCIMIEEAWMAQMHNLGTRAQLAYSTMPGTFRHFVQ
jgi:hypothetical protein